MTSSATTEPLGRNCTSYLGSATVSPLAIAGAYAGLANHGLFCPPRAVTAITGPDGPVDVPANTCTQVLEPRVADTVSDVLGGVTGGTGPDAAIGRPVSGKTGTTNNHLAAWFAGYTPQLATAVWVGRTPDPAPMRRIRINDRYYPEVFGNSLPAPIWAQIMREAHEAVPTP
jgi:membrane peptidoglycan carboxypeptidase